MIPVSLLAVSGCIDPTELPNKAKNDSILIQGGKYERWKLVQPGIRERKTVFVDTFHMDLSEVSVFDYRLCLDDGACSASVTQDANCNIRSTERFNHPMNCVNWFEAQTYCAWKGKRLPTSDEWELAARSPDGAEYLRPNERLTCDDINILGCERTSTVPVRSMPKGRTPLGLYHMAGNVAEWVEDLHPHPDWDFVFEPDWDPSTLREYRNGGYVYGGTYFDVTYPLPPEQGDVNIGFRCAMSAPEEPVANAEYVWGPDNVSSVPSLPP